MFRRLLTVAGLALLLASPVLSDTAAPPPPVSGPLEARYLSNVTRLTHDGEKNGEAYFSADGRQIIFQSVRDGQPYYQIYVMNADGTGMHRVSTGHGKTTCSFFRPDGRRIIYASTHLDQSTWGPPPPSTGHGYQWDFDRSFDIFSANPDGTDLLRLTDAPGYDAEDAYSPDGQKIVFTSNRDGDLEIYTMDADGKHQTRLTFTEGYDGGPFWSPDGKQILWRRFDKTGQTAQVMLMNADGSNQHAVTSLVGMNWAPYFHPDNQHIIFASNIENHNFELYLVDVHGNNLQRVTWNAGFDGLPVFSPDGHQVMWTSSRAGLTHIFKADFNQAALAHVLTMDPAQMRKDVTYLASPALGGRASGSPGADLAAKYVADRFQADGLQPGGDDKTFLEAFDVTTGVRLGKHNLFSTGAQAWQLGRDFNPIAFSGTGRADGPLVFVGYGLTIPGQRNDYAGVDVKGKIAVLMDGAPKGLNPTQTSLRFKAINARSHGAVGIIVLNGPHLDPADDISFEADVRAGDTGLPTVRVRRRVFPQLPLSALEQHPRSFALNARGSITVDLLREHHRTANVVGILPGADPKLASEVIVVGAHYDHLGMGGLDSLAASRKPQLHPGADDNASGTAALMAMADSLAPLRGKLPRTVELVAFSGEEMGLLGSAEMEGRKDAPHSVAMLNMDMVGRLRNRKLAVYGINTGDSFRPVLRQANLTSHLALVDAGGGYGPSDHTSFYLKNVPVLFFTTGVHKDYHRPTDTADKINYPGLRDVAEFVYNDVVALTGLAQAPKFHRDPGGPPAIGEGRRSIRAALGILPDYAASQTTPGVVVADVMEHGAGEQAGLQKGDRIIKFENVAVRNIYDYTFALSQHAPGDVVHLVVVRGGKTLSMKATLGRRHHE